MKEIPISQIRLNLNYNQFIYIFIFLMLINCNFGTVYLFIIYIGTNFYDFCYCTKPIVTRIIL